jgi:putative endonuclease
MKTVKQEIGAWGEEKAVEFLVQKGYEILERNYKLKKSELDIIAWREIKGEKTLCFVEVKTRAFDDGSAERATGHEKLAFLFRGAKEYCLSKNISLTGVPMQFEQVSVYGNLDSDCICKQYIIPIE